MTEHEHLLYEHQAHDFPEKEEYREALRQLHEACQREKHLHDAFRFDFGKCRLKPQDVVGFIRLGEKTFTILPKICADSGSASDDTVNMRLFLLMLYSCHNIELHKFDVGDVGSLQDQFLPALIGIFANRLRKELLAGVYHSYVEHEEDLPKLRQRLLVGQQVRHNFVATRFRCRFDEFTADNDLNRFLLSAVRQFSNFVEHTPALFQCQMLLQEGVEEQRPGKPPPIHWSRLNERFREPFDIACWLLEHLVPIDASDQRKGFLFLFRMYEVFEGFVAKLIKRKLEETASLQVKTQAKEEFNDLTLIPDILIKANDARFIIDTKYKRVKSTAEIDQDDKLQMYAYGANFTAEWVMLLYPRHIANSDSRQSYQLGKFQLGKASLYGGPEVLVCTCLFDLDPNMRKDELLKMSTKDFENEIIGKNDKFFHSLKEPMEVLSGRPPAGYALGA